jgi:hypothetical protein
MRNLFSLILLSFFAISLQSCFHKDVMSDRADDIMCTLLYTDKSGTVIINREEIFQATSKSSGGGMTRISGYAEYRLSAYDFATGKLLARVELGEGQKDGECRIIGLVNDKLWMFSMNPELDFHYRNPRTLETEKTQAEIIAAAPFNNFKFAVPDWPQIGQFYGMDAAHQTIIVTDLSGFRYNYNPAAQTLTKTTEDIISCDNWTSTSSPLNSSISINSDSSVNLRGEPRRMLQFDYKPGKFDGSYLKGEFIVTSDLQKLAALQNEQIQQIINTKDSLTRIIKELQQQFPVLAQNDGWSSGFNDNERKAYNKISDFKRDTAECNYDIRSISSSGLRSVSNKSITGNNTALIFHCKDVTDTSRCMISSLSLFAGNNARQNWSVMLNRYYFNPDKADALGAFETVMSDGNPEFRYRWFDIHDGKLIMISQLQMCAIDLSTGNIIWDIDL